MRAFCVNLGGVVLAWEGNPCACGDLNSFPADFIDLACALFVNASYEKKEFECM